MLVISIESLFIEGLGFYDFMGYMEVLFSLYREAKDESVVVLRCGVEFLSVKREEKLKALGRLRKCVLPFLFIKLN